ncbi:egl-9, partial [Symbiodinium sp. KB8]
AVDRLVADLRPFLPGAVELGAVDAREPVMLSCYPRGARYIRHYDNNCDTGEGDCNGRRLTVLYYLNEAASDSDGGHLRLIGQRGGVYDILPELDALVLFWADRRTPHEVLPNLGKDRYALSCWYVDTSEAPDAPAFKMPALAESQTP